MAVLWLAPRRSGAGIPTSRAAASAGSPWKASAWAGDICLPPRLDTWFGQPAFDVAERLRRCTTSREVWGSETRCSVPALLACRPVMGDLELTTPGQHGRTRPLVAHRISLMAPLLNS
jgi:hypothetical protein